MRKPIRCIVEQCPNNAHAKGYCRKHYGQIWRRGMIYESPRRESEWACEELSRRDEREEKMASLERELRKAQQMYDVVVGFEGRMKWRKVIETVRAEMLKLASMPAAALAAEAEMEERESELVMADMPMASSNVTQVHSHQSMATQSA